MVKLLLKVYRYNEVLSKRTKNKILKYKRRVEYFILFIPLMFIFTGYFINSLIYDDYTNFKLFHRFSEDFVYKVNFNILPISIIFIIIVIVILTMYESNIVYLSWISLAIFSLLYASVPNVNDYAIELMYQVNMIINEHYFIIRAVLLLIIMLLLLYSHKARRIFLIMIKNGVELFLLVSIVYLEIIGDYKAFFFVKSFINLFINSIKLFSGAWELAVTIFISLVFLSLYNKKVASLVFFIKNKVLSERELKKAQRYGALLNTDIIKISNKVEMPLLKHESLPKVGVIVPAFNESATISNTINSLLNVDYSQERLLTLVVSDGSTDNTVDLLKRKYDMYQINIEPVYGLIEHKQARAIYVSDKFKNLMLIDKINGGKADALNLGMEYLPKDIEYISVIDADSIVDKYAFRVLATNAKKDDNIAALTGTILPSELNKEKSIKSSLLTNIQLFDYLNSFHGERGALGLLNAILIVPGAFGFFKKSVIFQIKGYPQNVLAEDGLLTINIQRNKGLKIKFVPEALAHTQVPSTLEDLRKQRVRWFKGLTELLMSLKTSWRQNLKLSLVLIDYLFIEWMTPIMAPIGLGVIIANPKMITHPIFYVFMALAVITPIIQGFMCMLMESSYRKVSFGRLVYLPLAVAISPLLILWRNDALLDLKNRTWGTIKRY